MMVHTLPPTTTTKECEWFEALAEVACELEAAGITHFIDTGTLLGAVRDGAFIPWDNDIDIGVVDCAHHDPRLRRFIGQVRRKGFVANLDINGVGLFSALGVEVNIKLYRPEGRLLVGDYSFWTHRARLLAFLHHVAIGHHVASFGGSPLYRLKAVLIGLRPVWRAMSFWLARGAAHKPLIARVPADHVVPPGRVELYGAVFSAPGQTHAYLADRYGADWRTPRQGYDYTKDDRSISGNAEG